MFLLSSTELGSRDQVLVEPPTCPCQDPARDPARDPETLEGRSGSSLDCEHAGSESADVLLNPCNSGCKDGHSVGDRLNVNVEFGNALCERGELHM